MKRIIEYLPLISICFLYFGFCNLYYYYKEFNIEIYSFISTTDLFLIFLPKIVFVTSLLYTAILIQVQEKLKKPLDTKEKNSMFGKLPIANRLLEWWRKYIYWFVAFYYLAISLIIYLLQYSLHYQIYELAVLNLVFDAIFLGIIIVAIMIHEKRDSIFDKPLLVALFLVIFIGEKIGSYRVAEAQEIKAGITEYKKDHLKFIYNDSTVETSDSLLFIGETASHIFLYNLKAKESKVYSFEKIEELTIR